MKKRREIAATLTLALLASISVVPAPSSAQPTSSLATIPMSRQIDFTSNINGHSYRIQIAIPSGAAPTGGFPVLEAIVGAPSEFGGAGTFPRVIEQEIKPRVANVVPVARGRDILFGHSFGALFVLHALFTHPEAFNT
jgi:predicted alpha/beta superfamily hydrolase